MALISMRQLLDHAAEHAYGVPAFNINNMEQGLAIMEAAKACDAPVIIQASRGARSYANDIMLAKMIDALAEIYPEIARRGITPDIVTDQTSAHDLVYGYVPHTYSLTQGREMPQSNPAALMAASRASIVDHVTAMLGFQKRGAEVFDNGNLIRTHANKYATQVL